MESSSKYNKIPRSECLSNQADYPHNDKITKKINVNYLPEE